jgi:hypothetical protein
VSEHGRHSELSHQEHLDQLLAEVGVRPEPAPTPTPGLDRAAFDEWSRPVNESGWYYEGDAAW